jgi:hypothetical protein
MTLSTEDLDALAYDDPIESVCGNCWSLVRFYVARQVAAEFVVERVSCPCPHCGEQVSFVLVAPFLES